MSHPDLNLARKPFLNARPIRRTAALLWVLGGALLLFNALLYWDYFTSSEDRRGELTATQGRIDEHEAAIAALRSELGDLRLPQQNAQVAFLNRKIAERTFGWSRLFDDLEEVLPDDVRLLSLSPTTAEDDDERRTPRDERVLLGIDCIARNGEVELEFIDRLYADPAFSEPRLAADAVDQTGQIRFNLTVIYHPNHGTAEAEPQPAAESEADDDENEDGDEDVGGDGEGEAT